MKSWFVLLFSLVAVVQILVPISMIRRHEETLRRGERFLFECAPVDPAAALGGRYLALSFAAEAALIGEAGFVSRQVAYAGIVVGEDGFAELTPLLHEAPEQVPFLRVNLKSLSQDEVPTSVGDTVEVSLPFDRYYLNEHQAKRAEVLTSEAEEEAEEGAEARAHVAVRVRNGYTVIEELFLDGQTLEQYLDSL